MFQVKSGSQIRYHHLTEIISNVGQQHHTENIELSRTLCKAVALVAATFLVSWHLGVFQLGYVKKVNFARDANTGNSTAYRHWHTVYRENKSYINLL